ncbi:MAG TPA: hypothetical protein VMT16_08155, partial [Thermoanaerobaculia bacterium]|nr:hypothetical protein [Thermoanaerobaculia bacterium]
MKGSTGESAGFDPPLGAAGERQRRRRRRAWWLGFGFLALLGAVAHWRYWYAARAHPLGERASRLLEAAPPLPVSLWIPFPHQNLRAVGGASGDPRALLASAARLAGTPEPVVPRLAPFGLPPARELLFAADEERQRLWLAVRVYPGPALVARLAGLLAGNRWLAGGEVELAGAPAWVRWEGLTWRVERGVSGAGTAAPPGGSVTSTPLLARLDLRHPHSSVPAGTYRLARLGGDLVAYRGEEPSSPPAALAELVEREQLVLLLLRAQEGAAAPPAVSPLVALMLFDSDGGLLPGMPAAAAWVSAGEAEASLLPGGSLLRALGRLRRDAGGSVVATGREAGERAARAAEVLAATLSPQPGRAPQWAAWLVVGPASRRAGQLAAALAALPFASEDEVRRWRDVAILL